MKISQFVLSAGGYSQVGLAELTAFKFVPLLKKEDLLRIIPRIKYASPKKSTTEKTTSKQFCIGPVDLNYDFL